MHMAVFWAPVLNRRPCDIKHRWCMYKCGMLYSSGDDAGNHRSYPSGASSTWGRTELGKREALCITGDQYKTGWTKGALWHFEERVWE